MKCLIAALILLTPSIVLADWTKSLESTCRMNGGTGAVFTEDKEHIWIISAGHCVVDDNGKLETIKVEFFSNGRQSHQMDAEVLWHVFKFDEDIPADLAILKVKKSSFRNYPVPKPIPLAAKNYKIKVGTVIHTCGCARASWPTLFRGTIKSNGGSLIRVFPRPLPGRSGSGVFQNGKIIAIMLRADGAAVHAEKIHELLKIGDFK